MQFEAEIDDERVLEWVRKAHQSTTLTTSVCTGALILAAAGLLDGLTATTARIVPADVTTARSHVLT